jgi:hypothetical protein
MTAALTHGYAVAAAYGAAIFIGAALVAVLLITAGSPASTLDSP